MRIALALLIGLSVTRCGVEAGNAGGTKNVTGTVQILFAQQNTSSGESLNMQLGSLGLVSDSSSETSLATSVDSVDLFSKSSTSNVLVANSSTVPVGSYNQILVKLKGDKPLHYRDADGGERDFAMDSSSSQAFYLAQTVSVAAGEAVSIVVNLDPYRSLQNPSDGKYIFQPRGDAQEHDREVSYKGVTTVAYANWVCAYAYLDPMGDGGSAPRVDGDKSRESGGFSGPRLSLEDAGRPDFQGTRVEDRPAFGGKGELIKDSTSACEHAFAKAPVQNGQFEFSHLQPQSYALRVFTSNGSYVDLDSDITLSAPAR